MIGKRLGTSSSSQSGELFGVFDFPRIGCAIRDSHAGVGSPRVAYIHLRGHANCRKCGEVEQSLRGNIHSMNEPVMSEVLSNPSFKRADLHCHSRFSIFKYFKRANTRDCYNAPEDVYRIAKERGMSFVTLTDHDSIDGCLYLLNKWPDMTDFFIGEEVETYFPETGQRIHIGVWGLTEAHHREIQRLRRNIRELVPYLKSEQLVFG